MAKLLDLRSEEVGNVFGLLDRDEDAHFGVVQDGRLAFQVIFNLGQAGGWIDRHRNAPRHQDAEEHREELRAGGQHDRHGLSRGQVTAYQPFRDRTRRPTKLSVSGLPLFAPFVDEADMRTIRMREDVPVKHFRQRGST